MSTPPSKEDLISAIKASWAELNEVIAALDDDQMLQPGVQDAWTVKDILAHISAWEQLAMDRIHSAQTGEPLKFPAITGDEFVNAFNADKYEANKARPLNEVLDELQVTHQDFLAQIQSLDDSTLAQKLPFEWAGNLTFQVLISANTHWHYPEHIEAIQKWLEKGA
jgi:hypothetical protein